MDRPFHFSASFNAGMLSRQGPELLIQQDEVGMKDIDPVAPSDYDKFEK